MSIVVFDSESGVLCGDTFAGDGETFFRTVKTWALDERFRMACVGELAAGQALVRTAAAALRALKSRGEDPAGFIGYCATTLYHTAASSSWVGLWDLESQRYLSWDVMRDDTGHIPPAELPWEDVVKGYDSLTAGTRLLMKQFRLSPVEALGVVYRHHRAYEPDQAMLLPITVIGPGATKPAFFRSEQDVTALRKNHDCIVGTSSGTSDDLPKVVQ